MKKTRFLVITTLVASLLSGCIIHTHNRARREECHWDHGRKVCRWV